MTISHPLRTHLTERAAKLRADVETAGLNCNRYVNDGDCEQWIAEADEIDALLAKPPEAEVLAGAGLHVHYSDCAIYNAPAMPVGPCDCGSLILTPDESQRARELRRDPDSEDNERFASWYGDGLLDLHDAILAALSQSGAREGES